jgi:hypothetical protein
MVQKILQPAAASHGDACQPDCQWERRRRRAVRWSWGRYTARRGDVWLMRPWLLHPGSRNVGGRVITNFVLKMDRAVPL